MSKKHLTFDDRLTIQAGLQQGLSVAQIAKKIGKDRSTIGREIKAHRRLVASSKGNNCVHRGTCTRVPQCRSGCIRGKRMCQSACGGCMEGCPDYKEEFCQKYERSPFVCNACDRRQVCRFRRMLYDARYAQEKYEGTLSESRKGISLTEQELDDINDLLSPLIKQGQSVPVICENHRAELPVSDRTIYSYIEAGLLDARNMDLRRKMRRPERKKSGPELRVDKKCHIGRGYEDFQEYLQENPDPMKIEADTQTGEIQCRVFYCDPMNSNQKSNCERNHELIRYVIPKGNAKDKYTEEEIVRLMNHVNSYPRKKWNGQSPIDLFIKIYGEETATLLGLERIPSDSINLTPALLK